VDQNKARENQSELYLHLKSISIQSSKPDMDGISRKKNLLGTRRVGQGALMELEKLGL
jgi:hypothetical protein